MRSEREPAKPNRIVPITRPDHQRRREDRVLPNQPILVPLRQPVFPQRKAA